MFESLDPADKHVSTRSAIAELWCLLRTGIDGGINSRGKNYRGKTVRAGDCGDRRLLRCTGVVRYLAGEHLKIRISQTAEVRFSHEASHAIGNFTKPDLVFSTIRVGRTPMPLRTCESQ
jgi:hypothetical protein